MSPLTEAVRQYMSELGKKGGKVLTPKKRAALKENAKKPRPKAWVNPDGPIRPNRKKKTEKVEKS